MYSTAAGEAQDADDQFAALVAELAEVYAVIAAAQARESAALAKVGQLAQRMTASSPLSARDHDIQLRSFAAEIGALLRVSDRTVQSRIGRARTVVEDYPVAHQAWGEGRIGPGHLHVITDVGAPLPVAARAEFEAAAVQVCEGMTPGRAREALQIAADTAHPVSMADRHRDARTARGVRAVPIGDGMSEVIAVVPSVIADGAVDRLTRMARTLVDHRAAAKAELKELRSRFCDAFGEPISEIDTDTVERIEELEAVVDDDRTLDQVRADVIGTLLLTGAPGYDPTAVGDGAGVLGGIRGKVQVVVAATTLLGLDDHAADLVGHAPVDPDTARDLAGQISCGFERVIAHPVTGAVLTVDTYQRNTALDRFLRARDRTCRFFGCTMPAIRCDVDHTTAHAHGGHTSPGNCAHLCRRHHTLKHHSEWDVTQLPGGILEWTSPLGHVYTDHPPVPTVKVHFRPSDEPPPFRRAAEECAGKRSQMLVPLGEAMSGHRRRRVHGVSVSLADPWIGSGLGRHRSRAIGFGGSGMVRAVGRRVRVALLGRRQMILGLTDSFSLAHLNGTLPAGCLRRRREPRRCTRACRRASPTARARPARSASG